VKEPCDSVRAVLFDLGNTLVKYYRAEDFASILRKSVTEICEFVSEHTLQTVDSEKVFLQALDLNVEDPDGRVWPLEERLTKLFQNVSLSNDVLKEMIALFLRPIFRGATLDPDALPTLAAIRKLGIRTAIVSNTPWGSPAEDWARELQRHGLSMAVDAVVFCVDVGWRKPAPQIFKHALCMLGVEPQNATFVGDDPRWDVFGAEQCGLRPILLDPRGDFVGEQCQRIDGLKDLMPLLQTRQAK
jgi:putative hydrolase of the HAD superfamily